MYPNQINILFDSEGNRADVNKMQKCLSDTSKFNFTFYNNFIRLNLIPFQVEHIIDVFVICR